MKEYEAIRADLARDQQASSSSSSTSSSTSSSRRRAPSAPRNSSQAAGGVHPDVLDLRPWDTDGEDLFEWYALIKGPEGGSYAGEFWGAIQIPAHKSIELTEKRPI